MIEFTDSLAGIVPEQVRGFFVDWPRPPSAETHMRVLAGSDHFVLAIDSDTRQVVGYITALTDGVLTGYIPLLEVLPAYQRKGIGRALMERMLERLQDMPNVDLLSESDVVEFYEQFGMLHSDGMVLRRPMGEAITGSGE